MRKFVVLDDCGAAVPVEADHAEVMERGALVFRGAIDEETTFEDTIAAFAKGEWRSFTEVKEWPADIEATGLTS